jgi:LmbE family N-acetylglucosaminyl deacetylase
MPRMLKAALIVRSIFLQHGFTVIWCASKQHDQPHQQHHRVHRAVADRCEDAGHLHQRLHIWGRVDRQGVAIELPLTLPR